MTQGYSMSRLNGNKRDVYKFVDMIVNIMVP